jgi:hypothetical protein
VFCKDVAAKAALGGVIVALCCTPKWGGALAENHYSETEVCFSLDIKNVGIENSAIQVKDKLTFFYQSQLIPCRLPMKDDLVEFIFAGGECCDTTFLWPRKVISEIGGYCWGYQSQVRRDPYVIRWCSPIVYNDWPKLKVERFVLQGIGSVFDGKICPQLHGRRLGQMFELLLAGLPKFISGKPQTDSGNGKNNSEATDHALVVSFKESIDRVNRGDYSRVKGGAVFLIIVIGGLFTVLWLYQAKR